MDEGRPAGRALRGDTSEEVEDSLRLKDSNSQEFQGREDNVPGRRAVWQGRKAMMWRACAPEGQEGGHEESPETGNSVDKTLWTSQA